MNGIADAAAAVLLAFLVAVFLAIAARYTIGHSQFVFVVSLTGMLLLAAVSRARG